MVPNVQAVLARSRELKAIEHKFDQAGGVLAESASITDPTLKEQLYREWKKLLDQADKELAAFYKRYPKCLSRRIHPWVR